jgi:predicted dehydrogenase
MSPGGRVLIAGCGWISRQVHLPYLTGLLRAGAISSLAVTDTDPARAVQAARDFGVATHHGPAGEAKPDLVVIATPPRSHAALTLEALGACS